MKKKETKMNKLLALVIVIAVILVAAGPVEAGIKVCPDGYSIVHKYVRGGDDPLSLARSPVPGFADKDWSWAGFVTIHYCQRDSDGALFPVGDADILPPDILDIPEPPELPKVFYWDDGWCVIRQTGGPIGGQERPFIPMQLLFCGYATETGWEGFYR